MEWRTRYVVKSYLSSSMWLIPLAAYVVSLASIELLTWIDARLHMQWRWQLDIAVVQNVLQVFVAATLSFIVFTFGSLLVAVQIASAQLTPRIIATVLLRDNTIRTIAALFVLSFVFDLGLLARTQTVVLYVPLTVSLLLTLTSIGAFLYLMDYAARLLRPISIVWKLGEAGLRVIDDVYPVKHKADYTPTPPLPTLGPPAHEMFHRRKSAIVLAVNLDTLRQEAERTGGIIELACRVGDFVPTGEPLYRLYGGARRGERPATAGGHRHGPRAHHRAGRHLCLPRHCRHRDQGAVERHQRSDDRRAGDRPAPPPAAHRRPAAPARRRYP